MGWADYQGGLRAFSHLPSHPAGAGQGPPPRLSIGHNAVTAPPLYCAVLQIGCACVLSSESTFWAAAGAISMITMPAWADSGADAEAPAAEETSMLRFQSTYIWQKKNSFNAAYSGPNSLSSQAERSYTLTFDAYLGFKPWQGGELYFVPEITQGLALSSLTGLGGFTNGEATRVSGTNPTLYRQKLFLRQTWNQGGGQDKVDAAVDQMAGTVDRNRWVLTAGNFSTLDVFDDNAYAKDPRTQFMNWSGMSHTSFDYAADARGFGWGAALEWYQGPWVLRAGRMTGPTTPNGQPVDLRIFKH